MTLSRRELLRTASCGFGYLALAGLCNQEARAAEAAAGRASDDPLAPKAPHFAPRAKRVIFLFMQGGPVARRYVRLQAGPGRATTASRPAGVGAARATASS